MLISEVTHLINLYRLQPHPEGGLFAPFYKSNNEVKSTDDRYTNEPRSAGSSIHYLLNESEFSAWHRLKSDELWHFYSGCSVNIYVIDQSGKLTSYLLGDPLKISNASFQVLIKAGDWFAAENSDKTSYSFVGCTVSPGFEYDDFELGDRKELTKRFPHHRNIIERLTRE